MRQSYSQHGRSRARDTYCIGNGRARTNTYALFRSNGFPISFISHMCLVKKNQSAPAILCALDRLCCNWAIDSLLRLPMSSADPIGCDILLVELVMESSSIQCLIPRRAIKFNSSACLSRALLIVLAYCSAFSSSPPEPIFSSKAFVSSLSESC